MKTLTDEDLQAARDLAAESLGHGPDPVMDGGIFRLMADILEVPQGELKEVLVFLAAEKKRKLGMREGYSLCHS